MRPILLERAWVILCCFVNLLWLEFFPQLKTVAFIASKKNPAIQTIFIRFSIENLIANISLYVLSRPKLNYGCYLTFDFTVQALKPENFAFSAFL